MNQYTHIMDTIGTTYAMLPAPCVVCHTVYTLKVKVDAYLAWKAGALIQNVMPELHKQDRELLISNICGKCWDEVCYPDE